MISLPFELTTNTSSSMITVERAASIMEGYSPRYVAYKWRSADAESPALEDLTTDSTSSIQTTSSSVLFPYTCWDLVGTASTTTVIENRIFYGPLHSSLTFTARPPRLKGKVPLRRNHKGDVVRAESKGRQFDQASPEELVALQLLRKMVGPEDFRKYLKQGFVNVKGPSGLVYQIHRKDRIAVWKQGTKLASLCVHIRDRVPPTDEVVAKILLAEMDEGGLWKRSNVFWVQTQSPTLEELGVAA